MLKAARIELEGIVQGVGFRPFVHRLALRLGIKGFVRNTSRGVEIHAEARAGKLKEFFLLIQKELPPLARLTAAGFSFTAAQNHKSFEIRQSLKDGDRSCLISPDIAVCPECLEELFTKNNRRYLYPFINCTNCGPRFSIIQDLPYDRRLTTMKNFKMCAPCRKEFADIRDRRYHAQPDACPACGPRVELIKSGRVTARAAAAVAKAAAVLQSGAIIAVKGIGGFHISCDADNPGAVKKLRSLKSRPDKPFALMVADIKEAERYCRVPPLDRSILESPERPIVLLEKKKESPFTRRIAPDNNYLGVMLCYAPLHYLLFSRKVFPGNRLRRLVMTSANIADEPVEIDNGPAVKDLEGVCDYFLTHDRRIYNRSDDSIVQVIDGRPVILRRSRGYSPFPFFTGWRSRPTLACGAELKNTFCLAEGNFAFLSQYIGDLKTLRTFDFYSQAVQRLSGLFKIKPELIACDLHPDYLSTKYCRRLAEKDRTLKVSAVQHHQAHLAGVIAEQNIKTKVIGVCFDGIGYGEDKKIWGGEFFTGDLSGFRRRAHLEYVCMPGGDKATLEPFRMAISYLYNTYGPRLYGLKLDFLERHEEKLESIVNITGLNSTMTSSCGRLFDAVSALLGICDIITYEAQAAVRLQRCAEKSTAKGSYPFILDNKQDTLLISARELIKGIVSDLGAKVPAGNIARKFHNSVAAMSRDVCRVLRKKTGISAVCLCGGVFQNKLLLESAAGLLRADKFRVYYNELLPANDGAVSLGQAALANAKQS